MSDEPDGAPRQIHIHLVSDSSGDTIYRVARACLSQFDQVEAVEHVWSLVRSLSHLNKVLNGVAAHPGPVMFTLVQPEMRAALQDGCARLGVPLIPVLDPVIGALSRFLGVPSLYRPGRQHELDREYFNRIEAMQFALAHDDGQATWNLREAEVVLVGVSRTSKTPTCMYLANRGVKAANVPFVPGAPLPPELFDHPKALIVGLTNDPNLLVQIRRNRLTQLAADGRESDYVDIEQVRREVTQARRLFSEQRWPVIETTRRSIEETAAAILQMLDVHRGGPKTPED